MSKKKRRSMQEIILQNYIDMFKNLALSQFKWEGEIFQDSCSSWHLEYYLLHHAKACFIQEEATGLWFTLPFSTLGKYDIYGRDTSIVAKGANGEQINSKNFIIVHDNNLRKSALHVIHFYAKLLQQLHLTLESNIAKQKTPYLLHGESSNNFKFKNLMNEVLNDAQVISLTSDLADKIQVLNLEVPYNANQILETMHSVKDIALGELGVAKGTEKSERMLTDELLLNNDESITHLSSRHQARQNAIDSLYNNYGVTVSINSTTKEVQEDFLGLESEEKDGKIFDNHKRDNPEKSNSGE